MLFEIDWVVLINLCSFIPAVLAFALVGGIIVDLVRCKFKPKPLNHTEQASYGFGIVLFGLFVWLSYFMYHYQ